MLFIYRFAINFIFLISPIIIIYRIIKNKEDSKRFAEKIRHHLNANETKIAFTKIREAFEGRYSKSVEKENMIAAEDK